MEIKGKDKFLKQIAAIPQAIRDEVRKALEVSAEETVDVMKRFAPVDSGALKASIGYTFGEYVPDNANVRGMTISGGSSAAQAARSAKQEAGLSVTLHAGDARAWYARLVEFGTVAHEIKPKTKRVLAQSGENGQIFGTRVNHPGATAQPFFYPGYRFGRKRAKARLSRAISNGAKKAFGK